MKMNRKSTLVLAGALLLSGAAQAKLKDGGAKPAFDKGDKTLAVGVGYGLAYGFSSVGGTTVHLPSVSLIYDHGIVGNVGPGTIGIGGIVSWNSLYSKYNNGDRYTETNIIVGVRGTYHLTILKDKNNKFDPYAGVMAGVRLNSSKNEFTGRETSSTLPVGGAFVGAKYNFSKGFGVFAEFGYDISFGKVGINFNF